jgi:hypothetical protein
MTIIAASFKSESGDDYLVLVEGTLSDLKQEIGALPEGLTCLMLQEVRVIGNVLTERQVIDYINHLQPPRIV